MATDAEYVRERNALLAQLGIPTAQDPTDINNVTLRALIGAHHHIKLTSIYDRTIRNYIGSNNVAVGEETVPRVLTQAANALATTQVLRLTYFTARKTESISQVKMVTGGTAAGATPSLVRIGIYSVAPNGDLTLIASTPTDTALFAAANTAYTKALSAAFTKVEGQRYAVGLLLNTAAAFPTILGAAQQNAVLGAVAPILNGSVTAQADLPNSVATASVATSTVGPLYTELLP